MPRALRFIEPGAVYHLISRFVAKEWFIRTEEERACYLRLLGAQITESDWRCFTYAVMSNHVHLGMVAGSVPLASVFRPAHTLFAELINRSRERIGAVFTRGPKARRVGEGGVARLIGYVHHNPVRAGVVDHSSASTWTSHRAYSGLAEPPCWLDVELGIQLAGFHDAPQLDEWIARTANRGELDQAHVEPRPKRGRPKMRNPPEQEAGLDFVAVYQWNFVGLFVQCPVEQERSSSPRSPPRGSSPGDASSRTARRRAAPTPARATSRTGPMAPGTRSRVARRRARSQRRRHAGCRGSVSSRSIQS